MMRKYQVRFLGEEHRSNPQTLPDLVGDSCLLPEPLETLAN